MGYYYGNSGNNWMTGSAGSDVMYGYGGIDVLVGDGGDDSVYGDDGDDHLYGNEGDDVLSGGAGWDYLVGGTGADWVYSGSGYDYFAISYGESGTTWGSADSLMDYNRWYDYIDMNIAGTSSNYVELAIGYNAGFDQAAATAMFAFGSGYFWGNPNTNHCFITDGVNGYLFSDLNDDNVMDTGVDIRGLTSLDQFNWSDIV
jgi:Ca2+-binding RTX toxin-like protein